MINEKQLADWERRCGDYDFCEHEAYKVVPQLITVVRELKAKSAQFESEADWLAGHHGTDCVQYIDPHWACRDDKNCDDCWREASKINATEQKQ